MSQDEKDAVIKWLKHRIACGGVEVDRIELPLHELIQWVANHVPDRS